MRVFVCVIRWSVPGGFTNRGETFHLVAKITMGIQPSNGTNDLQRDTMGYPADVNIQKAMVKMVKYMI